MRRRQSITLMLMIVLIGGNASVVQVAAWTSMLIERAQRMDWQATLTSTFGGAEPCRMCHAAATLRDDGGTPVPTAVDKLVKKADVAPTVVRVALAPSASGTTLPAWPVGRRPASTTTAPEPPPPRVMG